MTDLQHIIFLTGFMGSGKSTVGPHLARRIGYDFADMDNRIEQSEGASIPDIFNKRGEAYFRRTEVEILRELSGGDGKIVVALGGGTLTSEECRNIVRDRGVLVYLQVSTPKVLERVGRNGERPMLLSPKGEVMSDVELSERIESLINEREKYYLKANLVINATEMTVLECVEEIASKLKGFVE